MLRITLSAVTETAKNLGKQTRIVMFLMVPMQHDNVHMSEVGVHPGGTLDEQNTKHGFKQTKCAGTIAINAIEMEITFR